MKSEANKWWPFGSGGWILIPNETPDKTPLGFHLRWNMFFISVRSNTCILMRCFYYRVTKLVETTTTKIIIIIIIINSYMYSTFLQVSQGASHLKIESYLKTSSQSLQSLKLINDAMKIFLKTSLHVCLQSFLTNVNKRAWFNVKRRGITKSWCTANRKGSTCIFACSKINERGLQRNSFEADGKLCNGD